MAALKLAVRLPTESVTGNQNTAIPPSVSFATAQAMK